MVGLFCLGFMILVKQSSTRSKPKFRRVHVAYHGPIKIYRFVDTDYGIVVYCWDDDALAAIRVPELQKK